MANLARYNDGKTAYTHKVQLGFASDGLIIRSIETNKTLSLWPYGDIRIVETPRSGYEYAFHCKSLPDERLAFADKQIFDLLQPHLSRHKSQSFFLEITSGKLALLAALTVIFGMVLYFSLPSLSSVVASLIPEQLEDGLGEYVEKSLFSDYPVCSSPDGNKALQKLSTTLSKAAKLDHPVEVKIVKAPMINAVALPGNRIIIFNHLVNSLNSPEQLAGVVAHEMGHVKLDHALQGIVQQLGIRAVLSLVFADAGDSDIIGDASGALLNSSYSRKMERAADKSAIGTLRAAGLPLKPFSEFFAILEKEGDGIGMLQYISTHPSNKERREAVEAEAKEDTAQKANILQKEEWNALQEICRN